MHWRLFANLAETASEREVDVEVGPNATFADALAALFERHPELEAEVLDEDGELYPHIQALRNGEHVVEQDGFDTRLDSGDELALFPPVSGG
ncbi:molybdopterin synthase sulfur carrier subunit [Halobacteriales archaeon QS_4_69_34]|nr:MAG: molybdopterin synthase sulfur carrier subunit [Halobacteriales archaeon QS_4_69_34]